MEELTKNLQSLKNIKPDPIYIARSRALILRPRFLQFPVLFRLGASAVLLIILVIAGTRNNHNNLALAGLEDNTLKEEAGNVTAYIEEPDLKKFSRNNKTIEAALADIHHDSIKDLDLENPINNDIDRLLETLE